MTKEEADLIITEQNKSTEAILKEVAKVKADYHELCKLKDMRIAELEKEIAELKESANFWEERYWILNDVYVKVANEKDNNLTKAKEIIKKFLLWENAWHKKTESKYELLKEAEQFLKEVSE